MYKKSVNGHGNFVLLFPALLEDPAVAVILGIIVMDRVIVLDWTKFII